MRIMVNCLSVCALVLCLSAHAVCQQSETTAGDVRALALGTPIVRDIAGGQVHSYTIQISAGQFMYAVVEQQGIDVVVTVISPERKKLVDVDSPNGAEGPEPVRFITETTGHYLLQVRSLEQGAAGRYTITVQALRPPTELDRKIITDAADLERAQAIENRWVPLYNAGHYAEAVPLAEEVLAIRERVLGPEHSDVALTLNSLALLYQHKNDFARAEALYKRSLAIDTKNFGADDPNLAITYGNLATLYYDTGEYAKAEPLMQKALQLRERAFGHDHPDVALTLHYLTRLYASMGNFTRAEAACEEALAIYRKVRPAEHPDIARTLNSLAEIYRQRGDYQRAVPLYQQALAIYERGPGKDHFETATVLVDLALMYHEEGAYARAEPLYQRLTHGFALDTGYAPKR